MSKKTKATERVDVAELRAFRNAQETEALETAYSFTMRDGTVFDFRPIAEWSYRCERAMLVGDVPTWARHALTNPEQQLDAFLDTSSRDIGRIMQHYIDVSAVSRGEDSSSSES
ncbi:hypothetical protein GCM10027294_43810 [Marinactinospora endophytica]